MQPVPADDHEGVPQAAEHLLEAVDGGCGGVPEQELHLVGEVLAPGLAGADHGRGVPRHEQLRRREGTRRRSGHDLLQRLEQHAQPAPAGVDHPGGPELRQQVRRAGQRARRRGAGLADHRGEVDRSERRRGLGALAGHREQGALDGDGDGGVAELGGPGQGALHPGGRAGLRGGQHLRQPAQQLRQDGTGVPPGPHQRAVRHRGHRGSHVRRRSADRLLDRLHGEQQVGAGVAVGHRVDVEVVDLAARRGQGLTTGDAPAAHGVGVEHLQHARPRSSTPRPIGPERAG